jgi:hypothetical protein
MSDARTVLVSRQTANGKRPKLDISDQIVEVVEERAMTGAPTLTLTLSDPGWLLANAPILDLDVDGRLDHVETLHDTEWFRLVQVSPQQGQLTLTFEDRAVSILKEFKGKLHHKATAHYTRSRFIRGLVDEANAHGHAIGFVSLDADTQDRLSKRKTREAAAPKAPGKRDFAKGAHLTVKGQRANKTQRRLAAVALNVAVDIDNCPKRAQIALMEALITESSITNLPGGDGTSVGILQLTSGKPDRRNVESCVKRFLLAGFTGRGGAVELANTTNLPAHLIAQAVQGSFDATGSNYRQWETEAQEWVRRFHGVGTESPPERTLRSEAARWYERGMGDGPVGENSWSCMNRLAEDARARIWVTDNVVYYAFDESLYKRAPRNVLTREEASVYDVTFDIDQGKPVQTMRVTVEGHDLWPGQTLDFVDVGPASTRWLVWGVRRTRSTNQTEVELTSPQQAKIFPRTYVEGNVRVQKKKKGGGSGGTDAPELKNGTAEVVRHAYALLGTPGQGTHSYSAPPNNWESDNAVDLGIPIGTPLYAAFDGRIGPQFGYLGDVRDYGYSSRFGGKRLHLIGKHDELYYAHMSEFVGGLAPGDKVKAGALLGWSGAAANVPHLHLGDKTKAYIQRYLGTRTRDPS